MSYSVFYIIIIIIILVIMLICDFHYLFNIFFNHVKPLAASFSEQSLFVFLFVLVL